MASVTSNVVQEGDQVVFMRHGASRVFQVRKNRQVYFEKNKFPVEELIGQPYGSMYEIQKGKLIKMKRDPKSSETGVDANVSEPTGDNRNLHDLDSNQKMSRQDIVDLKKKGLTGEKIIEELIVNSETFQQKTEFSKAKYLKKKKKVHILSFTVQRPTPRLVMDIFSKDPTKICNLRADTLSQLLNFSNVMYGSNVAVVENCHGLVLSSVLERMGGKGKLIQLTPTGSSTVNRQAMDYFSFSQEVMSNVYTFRMEAFSSLKKAEEEDNDEDISKMEAISEMEASAQQEQTQASTKEKTKEDVEIGEESKSDDQIPEKVSKVECETSGNADNAKGEEGVSNGDGKPLVSQRLQQRAVRAAKQKEAAKIIRSKSIDSLIIACKYNPLQILQNMLEYLQPSRPVVIYCQFIEPLVTIYTYIKDKSLGLQVQLSESWLRDYQILPQRTHPMITMSGTGGYLMTFMTCEPPM